MVRVLLVSAALMPPWCAATRPAAAVDWYVDWSATGLDDGTSWEDAAPQLQDVWTEI